MSQGYLAKDYPITPTGVRFETEDGGLRTMFDACERQAGENIRPFGDRRVMQEGAMYQGVWLETQPMGGAMYAGRDMEIALNNQLIFMLYQRRDGRLPGMITCSMPWKGVMAHYDWMQGDFFTRSALRMAAFIGGDEGYLRRLYGCLRDFDEYLWKYRDSDGDGCLESWCVWDTGDDNCTRLLATGIHARDHGMWCGETAPVGRGAFPMESAEYMAYSFSHNEVLARLARILGTGEEERFARRAAAIREKVRAYLWDEARGAVYDRDCGNRMLYTLSLSNLKCMYHGLFSPEMAETFVRRHLMNPAEFFTPLPLPSIAANDPLYYVDEEHNNLSPEAAAVVHANLVGDSLANSWSGPVEGLSVQRSLDALLRYGYHAEATEIGRRWIANLIRCGKYVQQYDPMTGAPCGGLEGYGPTVLSALNYTAYLYGVDFVNGRLIWSAGAAGADSAYTQSLFGRDYTLRRQGGEAELSIDGRICARCGCGVRLMTDRDGRVLSAVNMEPTAVRLSLTAAGETRETDLAPNGVVRWDEGADWSDR